MLVSFLLHWQALYIYVYLGNITVDVAIITGKNLFQTTATTFNPNETEVTVIKDINSISRFHQEKNFTVV